MTNPPLSSYNPPMSKSKRRRKPKPTSTVPPQLEPYLFTPANQPSPENKGPEKQFPALLQIRLTNEQKLKLEKLSEQHGGMANLLRKLIDSL